MRQTVTGASKISVLLPARNCGALLKDAASSILRQTFSDFELIVIDDGSSDGSIAAVPKDPRIRIIASRGRGISAALNSGAQAARAPVLARMDGDDIALPERLARQYHLLQNNPALGIVGAQVDIFTGSGSPALGYRLYQDWVNKLITPAEIRREIFVESPIPHPSAMMHRHIFDSLGGYRDAPWPEDYDLWLRAFAAGVQFAKPEGILLRWRDHRERTSRRDPRYGQQAFMRAKAHYLARTILKNQAAVIWGAAVTGAQLFDALAAEGVGVRAFLDIDPKKIGGRKRGRPVLPWRQATRFGNEIILGAVGARGARGQIRAALPEVNKCEGEDFWFVS